MKKNEPQLPADVEELLRNSLVHPPADFSQKLVQRISLVADANNELTGDHFYTNQPHHRINNSQVKTPVWQWLALAVGSVLGLVQTTGFVLGVWVATAAG